MKNSDIDNSSKPAAGSPKFVFGSYPDSLKEALTRELDRIKGEDPLAGAIIVVSSDTSTGYLEWDLAQSGVNLGNVRILPFDRLARLLEPVSSKKTVSTRNETALVFAALQSVLSDENPFGAAVEFPGFLSVINGAINDLLEAEVSAIPSSVFAALKPGKIARLKALAEANTRYREQYLPEFHTDRRRYTPVSPKTSIEETILRDCELLYFGLFDFNSIQFNYLQSLAKIAPSTFLFPFPQLENRPVPAYNFASRTIDRLTVAFPKGSKSILETPPKSLWSLFDYENIDNFKGGSLSSDLKVVLAGDPVSECQLIAGMTADLIFNRHIPPSKIGIVLWQPENYRHLMVQALQRALIPVYDGIGVRLEKTDAGKALADLLSMSAAGISGNQFVDLIQNNAIKKIGVCADDTLVMIEEIVNRCGIIKAGATVWENRLEYLSRKDPVEEREQRLQSVIGDLRPFLAKLFDLTGQVCTAQRFSEKIDASLKLIEEFIVEGDEREAIEECLSGFKPLFHLIENIKHETYSTLVASCLNSRHIRKGTPVVDGVAILSPMNARIVEFDHLFIPGMVQGAVPGVTRENPLLTDEIRSRINRAYSGQIDFPLPLASGRAAEEKMLFSMIVGSARKSLTLSYSGRSLSEGRVNFPSHYLLELCRIVTGSTTSSDDLRKLPFVEDWSDDDFPNGWEDRLVELRDYPSKLLRRTSLSQRASLFRQLTETRCMGLDFTNNNTGTRGSGSRWTEYDGFPGMCWNRADGMRISVTELEEYARCPFRCWLTKRLRLSPWRDPEVALDIPPEIAGKLLHGIYERLFGLAKTTGRIPLTDNDLPWAIAQIPLVIDHVCHRLKMDFPAPAGVWAMAEKTLMQRATGSIPFLIASQGDYRFAESEYKIEREMTISVDGEPIRITFIGKVDRIDTRDDHRGCHVIDYKSGAADDPDDVKFGTRLQLPLYLKFLMDRDSALNPGLCRASYYKVEPDGKLVIYPVSGEWVEQNRNVLDHYLETIAKGIIAGYFPPIPIKYDICRNCAVEKVCDLKSRNAAAKYRHDERLEHFLALRGVE